MWLEGLALAALAFAAIPVVNTLTTQRGLPGSLMDGDMLFAAFDLAMLVIATLLAFGSWRAAQPPRLKARRTASREMIHA